jgi:hypothetical protein
MMMMMMMMIIIIIIIIITIIIMRSTIVVESSCLAGQGISRHLWHSKLRSTTGSYLEPVEYSSPSHPILLLYLFHIVFSFMSENGLFYSALSTKIITLIFLRLHACYMYRSPHLSWTGHAIIVRNGKDHEPAYYEGPSAFSDFLSLRSKYSP